MVIIFSQIIWRMQWPLEWVLYWAGDTVAKHLCSPRPSHLPDLCFPCIAACRDRAEVPPFPWELDPSGRSHCQKPSCHPRTAVCSPLAGSAVSPLSQKGRVRGFWCWGGSWVAPWLHYSRVCGCALSWCLLIAQPSRPSTAGQSVLPAGMLRHSKQLANICRGGRGSSKNKPKRKEERDSIPYVFRFSFSPSHLRALRMSDSAAVVKRWCNPFRGRSMPDQHRGKVVV